MTNPKAGAFATPADEDEDDLVLAPRARATVSRQAAETKAATTSQPRTKKVREPKAPSQPSKPAAKRQSTPEASVGPEVALAVRAVVARERGVRGDGSESGRTIGLVVVDAIAEEKDRVQAHFKAAAAPRQINSLFIDDTVPKRRRHAVTQEAIPLTGIPLSFVTKIDEFAEEWGAPNRSALVDVSLRLYLKEEIKLAAAKIAAGKSGDAEPSDDDASDI